MYEEMDRVGSGFGDDGSVDSGGGGVGYAVSDMPEGTIVTEPYFSDMLVPVMLAR